MSNAAPLTPGQRADRYRKQTGRLTSETPRQRRRIDKKDNQAAKRGVYDYKPQGGASNDTP